MKTLFFAWRYLWARPLGAALNVLLLSLGLASITFLLLVGYQVNRAFERDLAGIDVVVGAKGSPMQLIMSGVFHLDVPPGNIPLKSVQVLESNPLIERVIPLSLGDSLQGFRIVGTSTDYLDHYKVTLSQGKVWGAPMEVVVGATAAQQLRLQVGSSFAGSHGLGEGGNAHEESLYRVVGVLNASGTVLDRLLLTDSASVWRVHEGHGMSPEGKEEKHADKDRHSEADGHAGGDAHGKADSHESEMHTEADDKREVTLALIRYKTPLAAMSFPRFINTRTDMQAAAPAVEISRLLSMLGLGTDVLRAFAGVLLLTAALSVFIALWSAVRERRADLALLRMLGAPPQKIALLLLSEALWLGVLASVVGLALGHGFAAALAWFLKLDQSLLIGGLAWPPSLWAVPGLALVVSLSAALIPAMGAYRISVLEMLQSR